MDGMVARNYKKVMTSSKSMSRYDKIHFPPISNAKMRIRDVVTRQHLSRHPTRASTRASTQYLDRRYETLVECMRKYNRERRLATNKQPLERMLTTRKCFSLTSKMTELHADLTKEICMHNSESESQKVRKINKGLKSSDPIIVKYTKNEYKRRERILCIVEATLYRMSGDHIHGMGLDFLRSNIGHPLIRDYIIVKGNGATRRQHTIDVIRDIIKYYHNWMEAPFSSM